jgi:signal transduction histidine kinase
MVGDLMDLSRLEASRLELTRRPVDVPALIHASVERARLETSDRPFVVRAPGPVPDACGDPDRIEQVLENLLTNAVKYGSDRTPITLCVARDGDCVAVSVANEGRTLGADEIAHLFERFHRVEPNKTNGIKGTGLGLYITRSLVEAHGGHIAVESTPGGITTFRFTVPIAH